MRDLTYPPVIVIARSAFFALGMKFQSSGTRHIPREGGAVLASNHIGYVDWIFNGLAARPSKRLVRFMAKKEAFKGFSGVLMRSFHHISVDRGNGEGAYQQAVQYCRDGEIVGLFPEATVGRSFELREFKTGAARMAHEAGVPLIPMAVWGTQLILTKGHSNIFGRGTTIAMHVGEPIETTGDAVADTQKLKAAIAELLEKAIAEYPLEPAGHWWAPRRLGGTAPTLEEGERLEAEAKAKRAAKKLKP